jgi:hypothetical protein
MFIDNRLYRDGGVNGNGSTIADDCNDDDDDPDNDDARDGEDCGMAIITDCGLASATGTITALAMATRRDALAPHWRCGNATHQGMHGHRRWAAGWQQNADERGHPIASPACLCS